MTSLKNVKLPELSTIGISQSIKEEDKVNSLSFRTVPISVNVGVIDDKVVVDLCEEEERYLEDKGHFVFGSDDSLLSSDIRFGKCGVTVDRLKAMIETAQHNAKSMRKQLAFD